MEVFGTLLSVLNFSFGFLDLIAAFFCFNILRQIRIFKQKIKEKKQISRALYKQKILRENFNDSVTSEYHTTNDSISYIETKT